jgi:hypothetical protein
VDVAADALDGLTMASRLEALRLVTGPGREFTDDERIKSAIDKERAARRSSPGRAQDYWEWLVVAEQLLAVKSQASSARPCCGARFSVQDAARPPTRARDAERRTARTPMSSGRPRKEG